MPEAESALAPDVPAAEAVPEQPVSEAAPLPAVTKPDETTEKPKGVQKRLDELTRNWREEQRRSQRLEQQNQMLLEQALGRAPKPEPETEKGLADFGYDEKKYSAYVREQATKSAPEIARQEAEKLIKQREYETQFAKFTDRELAFAETVEGYYEATDIGPQNSPNWACSPAMADAIVESDEGPALKFYLANNKDIALKLYHLSPVQAGREIARIEDRIVAERKKAAEKPVSEAPPPPPKIEGAGDPGRVDPTAPESDSLSDEEWLRKREKQIQARKKRT